VSVVLVPITAPTSFSAADRGDAVQLGKLRPRRRLRTAPVIALAGLGLVPYAIMQLQQFAFYALRDTRTPAVLNVPVVA
jgi:putative peptidoglycan lipid II flippase